MERQGAVKLQDTNFSSFIILHGMRMTLG